MTFHWQRPHLMVGHGRKVEKTHGIVLPPLPNPHPRSPLTCSLEDRVKDGDVPSARECLGLIHQYLPHCLVPPQDDSGPRPKVDSKDIPYFSWSCGVESRSHSLTQEKDLHFPPASYLPVSLPCRLQPQQGRAETGTLWSPPSLTYITWPQASSSLGFTLRSPRFAFKNYRDSPHPSCRIFPSQPTQHHSSKSKVYSNVSLQREPSYTVGENVNWCNQYGEQYGCSSENKKYSCHMTQQSHSWRYVQKKHTSERLRTSRCTSWVQKRQRNKTPNCQHSLDHRKSKGILEKHLLLLHWLCKSLWLCGS